jgi:hypothetical protein
VRQLLFAMVATSAIFCAEQCDPSDKGASRNHVTSAPSITQQEKRVTPLTSVAPPAARDPNMPRMAGREPWGNSLERRQRYGTSAAAIERAAKQDGAEYVPFVGMFPRCEDTTECSEQGRCAGIVGECLPVTEENCRSAIPCDLEGACSVSNGRCVVGPMDSCRRTYACANVGQCTKVHNVCTAASRADCQDLVLCESSGLCTPVNGLCIAATDADCRNSGACKGEGKCSARSGACEATSERDCKKSSSCRWYEKCFLVAGECVVKATNP